MLNFIVINIGLTSVLCKIFIRIFKMRLLLCVWRSTNRPAGENCNVVERPPAIRTCESDGEQLAPCPELTSYDIQRTIYIVIIVS